MRRHIYLTLFATFAGCVDISGTQTFEAVNEFSLPATGGGADVEGEGSATITAVGAGSTRSFAQSVFNEIDDLRDSDHVDSAEVSLKILTIRLSTNTSFAGVESIQAQLVTASGPIELCNRTLSERDQQQSSIVCTVDENLEEVALRRESGAADPTQVSVELEVSSGVTASALSTAMTFEVNVDVSASL